MKIKRLLSSAAAILIGLSLSHPSNTYAAKTDIHTISKQEAQSKAEKYLKGVSKQANSKWQDTHFSESKTLYDLEGQITGYLFQVQKNNEDLGYIIADSKNNGSPILESTREGSNPYKNIDEGKAIYTGPLHHLKKEKDKVINIHTSQAIGINQAKSIQIDKDKEKQHQPHTYNAPQMELNSQEPDYKEHNISNVPDYTWYHGCSPTAIANLVAYWGQHGYDNLFRSNETSNQLIDNLGAAMGTDSAGSTIESRMKPGLEQYFQSRGYNPVIGYDEKPTYEKYIKEIDSDRPIIINTLEEPYYGNHTMTGIGYMQLYLPETNENYRDIVVHDTWSDSPTDAYVNYDKSAKYFSSYITVTPFSLLDVPKNHWAYNEITYMVQKKFMSGYGNGYFGPTDNITREQLAAVLYRYLKPQDTTNNPFTDIYDNPFKKEILALTKMGIFSVNPEKKFNPKNITTRAEIAAVLTKSFDLKVKAPYEFDDMKGHWANEYVKALYSNGIASGTGGKNFSPNAPVTREQMAMFLYRSINLNPNFMPNSI
ncbi:TPA: S-layer homology domain-containing protein [Bacillus cereus]